MSQEWKLYVCGARGSRPVCGKEFLEYGGATSCYILKKEDYALIMDCGSGLNKAKDILNGCRSIDIFLSHLHYDHIIGLLDCSVFPSEAEVRFFGTFDLWFGEHTIEEFFRPPFWPVIPQIGPCIPIALYEKRVLREELSISVFPARHPNDASVLRVDMGEKSICVLFDYEHGMALPGEVIEGCCLMLYDGMYTSEEYPSHIGWGHSCWEEGCKLAEEWGVERLIIVHHAPERTDEELHDIENQAKQRFSQTSFARMGDCLTI